MSLVLNNFIKNLFTMKSSEYRSLLLLRLVVRATRRRACTCIGEGASSAIVRAGDLVWPICAVVLKVCFSVTVSSRVARPRSSPRPARLVAASVCQPHLGPVRPAVGARTFEPAADARQRDTRCRRRTDIGSFVNRISLARSLAAPSSRTPASQPRAPP